MHAGKQEYPVHAQVSLSGECRECNCAGDTAIAATSTQIYYFPYLSMMGGESRLQSLSQSPWPVYGRAYFPLA